MSKRKTVGFLAFLRGNTDPAAKMPGCANYDHHHGGCLFEDECLVEQVKRCGYFERVVLPTVEDIGLKSQIYILYAKQVGIDVVGKLNNGEVRKCPDCQAELKPRQRYCDKCTKQRRQQTYRRSRQKKLVDAQHLTKYALKILQS